MNESSTKTLERIKELKAIAAQKAAEGGSTAWAAEINARSLERMAKHLSETTAAWHTARAPTASAVRPPARVRQNAAAAAGLLALGIVAIGTVLLLEHRNQPIVAVSSRPNPVLATAPSGVPTPPRANVVLLEPAQNLWEPIAHRKDLARALDRSRARLETAQAAQTDPNAGNRASDQNDAPKVAADGDQLAVKATPVQDLGTVKGNLVRASIGQDTERQSGCPIVPMRTAFVDRRQIPPGTLLYIKQTHGWRLPGGKRHDGLWFASDAGDQVEDGSVELYTGSTKLGGIATGALKAFKVGEYNGCPK